MINNKAMNMTKNEMRRVPGFTAENALEQGAPTPYAGLASRGGGGGEVEPAFRLGFQCTRSCAPHGAQLVCETTCVHVIS